MKKNVINNNIKYIIAVSVALVFILIGIGIYQSSGDNMIEPNIYFRKQYGYLGMKSDDLNTIQFSAFNVGNQDVAFLEDSDTLNFGIEGIEVISAEISHGTVLREVEYIALTVTIKMHITSINLTKLISSDGVYEIGSINIEVVESSNAIVDHGVNSLFVEDGLFTLSLGNRNEFSIIINDFTFHHERIYDYELENNEFPIIYSAETVLMINMWISFNIDTFDIFVLRPVLRFSLIDQEGEEVYFVPLIPTKYEVPMNYSEIKEYIENA